MHISSLSFRGLVALLLLGLATQARAEALFDAKSTYAVVAGVLEWKDPGLSSFPKEDRKDKELFDTLGKLGVPAGQRTLLLDQQATASAFADAVRSVVAKAPAGSTIILYYAGHGVKDNDGNIIFASADINLGKLDTTGLHLSEIPGMLKGFKGKRVLLLADCCYSGGLAGVADDLSRTKGLQVLALTSAEASNISTANWTYSQTLIDALSGRPLLDRDDNGSLTLGELASEVKEGMRCREGQRSGWVTHGVPEDVVVARSGKEPEKLDKGEGDYERRDWVIAPHGDQRAVARILGSREGKGAGVYVEFYDYATATREWVPKKDAQPLVFKTWPVGSDLQVTWAKKIYDAKVVRIEDGFMWITYPGWDAKWDEWITAKRVVGAKADPAKVKSAQVEWRGRWYDATVNSQQDGQFCISYVGYGPEWDECVPKKRIRFK